LALVEAFSSTDALNFCREVKIHICCWNLSAPLAILLSFYCRTGVALQVCEGMVRPDFGITHGDAEQKLLPERTNFHDNVIY
jgi:hypothetical protein